MSKEIELVRLNPQKNTVHYAQILKYAIHVFGNQQLAEDWLNRPCHHLEGNIPLELISNSKGFQKVENYLARVDHGVYQ
jgi:putative toxin-antitoxin system antitoxin component (TIGR02293 family)